MVQRIVMLVLVAAVLAAALASSTGVALADKKDKDKKNKVTICHYTGAMHVRPGYEDVPVIEKIQVKKRDVPSHLAHGDFLFPKNPGPGFECQFGG